MTRKTKKMNSFFTKKNLILTTLVLLVILGISGIVLANRTKNQIKELFKMNKVLQEQNYYMAEFEYKMLGIAYYLDKGHYKKSFSLLNRLHKQLKTKEKLIRMPKFINKEDELEFYLNLQNPKTGAFMDDAYPLNSYHGPTENVLLHIEKLATETGQPLRLKYPLKYLDEINTPTKLIAVLDDWSTIGWIASKLPQTSFHSARDILSLARDNISYNIEEEDLVIQKHNLYNFSPEWRQVMLKWFWENQDPETGLWGPKSNDGKLLKKDLNNTASILKAFVDENGNNIHEEFPLRYKNELFESALEALSEPVPSDEALDELHEWNLKMPKSIRLLTRYIWKDASPENKEKAKMLIENFIRIKCEKYYISEEGAFSYYPGGEHATLDGTGGFFIFKEIGAFSSKQQKELWGAPEKNIIDLDSPEITELTQKYFDLIASSENINSLRFYRGTPDYDNLTSNIFAVVYPRKTFVLDIMDLTHKMKHWVDTTPQTMGNWVAKTEIKKRLDSIKFEEVPIYEESIPFESANEVLQKNNKLVVIGFDVLQVPRYKIVYTHP
jgi:hypothetical protein